MRYRGLALLSLLAFGVSLASAPIAHAAGLKLAPLEYRTQLAKGEKKKGFVDVSNPSGEKVLVKTSVQAFQQIDNKGSLEFFDSEAMRAGVKLDLDEFELGPREAIRMYFQLDGTKLPEGDVYGAIFFTTQMKNGKAGVGQQVRLGSLLSIVNGTPASRQAKVTGMNVPFFQSGDTIKGSYTIQNMGNPQTATGFYPTVKTSVSPFGTSKEQTGSLVFAGRSRENNFELKAPVFGFYNVSASFGDSSSQSRIVFVAKPWALVGIVAFVVALIVLTVMWRRRRTTRRR